MWKNQLLLILIFFIVCGFIFFPLYTVISVLIIVLTGLVYSYPLNVHVASLRLWINSFQRFLGNNLNDYNRNDFHRTVKLSSSSDGFIKSRVDILTKHSRVDHNLIHREILSNELHDSLTMPLKNNNLNSITVGVSKTQLDVRRKTNSVVEPINCAGNAAFASPGMTKNVQSVAGPLLVSTKFNSVSNSELTADARSMGLSGRIAQRASANDNTVTHQQKYSGIGVFPIVNLHNKSPKPIISPRNSPSTSIVKIRIAPPDKNSFSMENSLPSPICENGSGEPPNPVLRVLKEISRKRMYSERDEEDDDENVKRQKKELQVESTSKDNMQNKRGRDDSPNVGEEVKRQRRLMNTSCSNEIMSSLSSSIAVKPPHLIKGTKRKANDFSRSNTPVSGKLFKVNVSPSTPDNADVLPNSNMLEEKSEDKEVEEEEVNSIQDDVLKVSSMSTESNKLTEKQTSYEKEPIDKVEDDSDENSCIRIEGGQRRVLARSGFIKQIPVHKSVSNDVEISVNDGGSSISVQKIKDPGRRLKEMLAAIDGKDDIDAETTSMSPNVIAILNSAKGKNNSEFKTNDNDCATRSILRPSGTKCTNKSVRFEEVGEVKLGKNTEPLTSTAGGELSHTCLSTVTNVSNSIFTSISSASETALSAKNISDTKTTNSTLTSPNLSTVSQFSLTTSASLEQPKTNFNYFASNTSSKVESSVTNTVANDSKSTNNSIEISRPSNKFSFGSSITSNSSGVNSSGNNSNQVAEFKSAASNPSEFPKSEPNASISSAFLPNLVTTSSLSSNSNNFKSNYTFNANSKPNDYNSSNYQDKKPDQKPQGGFNFENSHTTKNNNKNVIGLNTPASKDVITSTKQSNSGLINFMSSTPKTNSETASTQAATNIFKSGELNFKFEPNSTTTQAVETTKNSIFSTVASSNTAASAFGTVTTQSTVQSPNSSILFGLNTAAPAFDSVKTPQSTMQSTNSSATLFGLNTAATAFGSVTTPQSTVQSANSSASLFGSVASHSSNSTAPLFGSVTLQTAAHSTNTTVAAFGSVAAQSTNSTVPVFGSSSGQSTNTMAPMFGTGSMQTNNSTVPVFGSVAAQSTTQFAHSTPFFGSVSVQSTVATTPVFGSINSQSVAQTATSTPTVFGSIATSQTAGPSPNSSTLFPVTSSNVFGNKLANATSQAVSSSGTSQPNMFSSVLPNNSALANSTINSNNTSNLFSQANTTISATTNSAFNSTNSNRFNQVNKSDGFGSSSVFGSSNNNDNINKSSLFNSLSSNSGPQSGAFGSSNATTPNLFSTSTNAVNSTTATTNNSGFGQTNSLFAFGSQPSTVQNSVFSGNTNSIGSSAPISNGTSFSAFGSSTNNIKPEGDSKQSTFGSGSFQTPTFNFGASTPSSKAFTFGGASSTPTTTAPSIFNSSFKPPEVKPFTFDASQNQSTTQNPAPVFAFGQNASSQPVATPSFQFNAGTIATQQNSNSGIFNFGSSSNTSNVQFGTGLTQPNFSIGVGNLGVQNTGGFNIGSGRPKNRSRRPK